MLDINLQLLRMESPPQIQQTTAIPVSRKIIKSTFSELLAIALEQEDNSIGYKYPKALVPPSIGKQLLEADPLEDHIHVCLPNTELNPHRTKYLVWERADWQTSYANHLRQKEESRIRIEKWEYRKAKIAELQEVMADALDIRLDATNPLEEPLRQLLLLKAEQAVDQNNITLARQFGVTL